MLKRLYLTLLLLLLPFQVCAEYTDSCGLYAQMLWSAADEYDSAKSNYESACDPYIGYNKDDESACGAYGYERSSYESAKSELEDALDNVATFCDPCAGMLNSFKRIFSEQKRKLGSEIDLLKKRIAELEAENKALSIKSK